jgi:hypothetical protein
MYTSKPKEIQDKELENSRQITRLILDEGVPQKDKSIWLQSYRLSELGERRSNVADLLNDLTPKAMSHPSEGYRKPMRDCLRLIIYGLIASFYRFEWLAIPLMDKHYRAGSHLGKLGLSRRRVQRALEVLKVEGLMMEGRRGWRDLDGRHGNKASQYYPTQHLMSMFETVLYEFDEDFDLPTYHRFNDFPPGTLPVPSVYLANDDLLRRYNHFMEGHWWARKGPTTRSFSENLLRGGRVSCQYQSIVNRRLPVRISTLIDGEPIAEPDFSCNHLRMAAALIGEDLPPDPYTEVANLANCTRSQVKSFVTMVIGCRSLSQKGGQMSNLMSGNSGLTINRYKRLLDIFERLYPWIKTHRVFYGDAGARMQRLEGEVSLRMFEWATREEIPLLSVHDSFAVREKDLSKTEIAMRRYWEDVMESSKKDFKWGKI